MAGFILLFIYLILFLARIEVCIISFMLGLKCCWHTQHFALSVSTFKSPVSHQASCTVSVFKLTGYHRQQILGHVMICCHYYSHQDRVFPDHRYWVYCQADLLITVLDGSFCTSLQDTTILTSSTCCIYTRSQPWSLWCSPVLYSLELTSTVCDFSVCRSIEAGSCTSVIKQQYVLHCSTTTCD